MQILYLNASVVSSTRYVGELVGFVDMTRASTVSGYAISTTKNILYTAGTPATYTDIKGTANTADDVAIIDIVLLYK